jgi:hypothetical protein
MSTEDMLTVVNEAYEEHGDVSRLKCSFLAECAVERGFNAKAYDFRRNPAVRARIEELNDLSPLFTEGSSLAYKGLDVDALVAIPLSIAGWLRYLLAVDDQGQEMSVSPDPLLEELQTKLQGVVWNDPGSYNGQIRDILSNTVIFRSDLTQTPLADKIENMFVELLAGTGAVRSTLQKYLQ